MRAGAGRDLRWFLLPAAAGVPLGLLWWWLAPTAQVQVARVGDDVVRYSAAVPELDAVQDVTLLLPSVVFGLVTGLVVLLRGRDRPSVRSALAAAGSLAGSGIAYLLGHLLGPGPIPVAEGDGAAAATGTSPLELHSWGVLLVWAVVALLVMTVGHLAAVWSTRADEQGPDEQGRDEEGTDERGSDDVGGLDHAGNDHLTLDGPDAAHRGGDARRIGS